jgi:hypothetical protein
MTKEIRFTLTEKFDEAVSSVCGRLGVDKSDYARSLIISDLREKGDFLDSLNTKDRNTTETNEMAGGVKQTIAKRAGRHQIFRQLEREYEVMEAKAGGKPQKNL